MNSHRGFAQRQQGAALVVGLMLLLVLTIITLSGMKNTARQQLMVVNNEYAVTTFEAAESSVRFAVNRIMGVTPDPDGELPLLRQALDADEKQLDPPELTIAGFRDMDMAVTVSYQGLGNAPGFSLGAAGGNFVAHRFHVDGTSVLSPTSPLSNALHRQGMQQIGPR